MRKRFCCKEDDQIAALTSLQECRDLRAMLPIFLGCVSNDNRGDEVRAQALYAIDRLTTWIDESAKLPALEVNKQSRSLQSCLQKLRPCSQHICRAW